MTILTRVLVTAALLAVAAAVGWWWRRRDGRVRTSAGTVGVGRLATVGLDTAGAETLALLLGTPTCTPCTTVRQLLGELAARRPDFRWIYLDAGEHLDLAREHDVLRVPTLLLLDPRGRVLARASGVPDRDAVVAVLDRDRHPASAA